MGKSECSCMIFMETFCSGELREGCCQEGCCLLGGCGAGGAGQKVLWLTVGRKQNSELVSLSSCW